MLSSFYKYQRTSERQLSLVHVGAFKKGYTVLRRVFLFFNTFYTSETMLGRDLIILFFLACALSLEACSMFYN